MQVFTLHKPFLMVFSYTKPKGQLPDYNAPIVLPADKKTVDDLCLKIHKSLVKDFKWYACNCYVMMYMDGKF
jgi:ribosome-interacting GTPase 1